MHLPSVHLPSVHLPSVQNIDIRGDASVKILEIQVDLHREAESAGQLHEERWMLPSLNTSDVFIAAIILLLVLLQERAQGSDQDSERSMLYAAKS